MASARNATTDPADAGAAGPGAGKPAAMKEAAKKTTAAKPATAAGKKAAARKVSQVMHEFKEGGLVSGSGRAVTSRKQAIAIGLSEAREAAAPVASRQRVRRPAS